MNKKEPTLIQKNFGARIRELRMSQNLSQEKLEGLTGLDRTYISGIERGIRNPSLKVLSKLAKALKMTISEMTKIN
jgi:transcriptional regulator with XRE-family HTH domain